MTWQYTPYMLPSVIAVAMSLSVTLVAWRRRQAPGAVPLVLLASVLSVWSFGNVLELSGADIPTKFFWMQVEHIGVAGVGLLWLIFALDYTGRQRWLTRPRLVLLAIVPLLTIAFAFSNSLHGWMWRYVGLDNSGPFLALDLEFGPWWWVNVAYGYPLILAGATMFVHMLVRSPHLYRRQIAAVLLGILAPWVSNAMFVLGINPIPHLDFTPFAFSLGALCFGWAFFRFRMLDIAPVARDAVIESMSDGMIVLDMQNRIVDLNPAAEAILGFPSSQAIGQSIKLVLSDSPELVERYRHVMVAQDEIALGQGESKREYDLRISPLNDRRGRASGRVVVLRDITERKQAEQALSESRYQLEASYQRELEIAHQIQTSLLPASAPDVQGLDIAGFSQPARQTGGDFYNYFAFGQDRIGIAVGDVSGKGTQAALMMALSVGLLTTEVRRELAPAALLAALNVELQEHTRRNKMNTAMCYLTLERSGTVWDLCAANAGGIAPLARRVGGQLEWLNVSGLPLGILALSTMPSSTMPSSTMPSSTMGNVQAYVELRQVLTPGDVLILISDGIVEAMNAARELYGFERFATRVSGAPGGSTAHQIRDWILADVSAFVDHAEQQDDITLVVVAVK
ncbi:MAG: SpoIIE family protein phosphatase [Thermoflexales bacterium]|nr:SpoIIE family protein phosphatase [Thermoflexales bacterium]